MSNFRYIRLQLFIHEILYVYFVNNNLHGINFMGQEKQREKDHKEFYMHPPKTTV